MRKKKCCLNTKPKKQYFGVVFLEKTPLERWWWFKGEEEEEERKGLIYKNS